MTSKKVTSVSSSHQFAIQLETVNLDLARELASAKEALASECQKTEQLTEKINKLSILEVEET